MIKAFIFDVDGTLLDTNTAHINAWHRALLALGHEVALDQIAPEIGKGGDKLVPSILGERIEREQGERIRAVQSETFLEIAARTQFIAFEGALPLLRALRQRKLPTCLATSSSPEHFDAMLKKSNLDLRAEVDHVVARQQSMESKPAPDLIEAAVEKLGVPALECVMVGDTPHDGEASRRAHVHFAGVLCGGNLRKTLLAASAFRVYKNPTELLEDLDTLLSML